MEKIIVAPSVLSADFSIIKQEMDIIRQSGAPWVHLDVMDGNFVPNITFGPKFINDIRKNSDLFFDTHLMINNPEKYIREFAEAGSDSITIHCEACPNTAETLQLIKSFGCKAGVAINPETDISEIIPYADIADMFLIMTVHPGFGGQSLIFECLDKVKALNEIRGNRKFLISVDGGINNTTQEIVKESGVDVMVSGSAFFKAVDKFEYVNSLSCNK